MKQLLLFATAFLFAIPLQASILDSLSIGFAGGYNNFKSPEGEIYLKSTMEFLNRNAELKFGLTARSYESEFDKVKDLDANSVGLFGDIAVYPFNKGFFAGLRWELVTFNWLNSDSKSKVENLRNYQLEDIYSGTNLFLQVGYKFRLSEKAGIKLYVQPGIQEFKLSNTSYFSQASVSETRVQFICNLNLAVEFRIK